MRAMDMIEPAFREKYEAICVGNKSAESQHVFFEGLLLEEGLGTASQLQDLDHISPSTTNS